MMPDVAIEEDIRQAVLDAADRVEVRAALDGVYQGLAGEIAQRGPRCELSGRCCRFEEYGHRLYVTTIELAAFVHGLRQGGPAVPAWEGTGCPFQVAKLCSVHSIRPFGCRAFFCDPTAAQWQNEVYERLHGQIKRLHDHYGIPYFYLEWRNALRLLNLPDLRLSATPFGL
jgi:Fe-S-cluster containining protein